MEIKLIFIFIFQPNLAVSNLLVYSRKHEVSWLGKIIGKFVTHNLIQRNDVNLLTEKKRNPLHVSFIYFRE